MASITHFPLAHLASAERINLRCENLIEILEKPAVEGRSALVFLDRDNTENSRSYSKLLEDARTVAHYLKNRGLKRGDKVVLLLLTSDQFLNCLFGTILAGGIPVAASPPMTFGDIQKYLVNLNYIVANSEAKFLITFPRIKKVIGNVLAGQNNLKEMILAKDIGPEPPMVPGFPSIDPEDPAFFQYTSGSTGAPKGVVLTHRALLANVAGIQTSLQVGPEDVCVSWLPLFHDMGLIGTTLSALYSGTMLYTMLPEAFVMNPFSWMQLISRYRASIAVAPNFAYHLCATRIKEDQVRQLDLSSLRVALNGAEPIDLRTIEMFEERFAPVGYGPNVSFPVYGLAENCLAVTFPRLGQRFEVERLDRQRLEIDGRADAAEPRDPFPYQAVSVGSPLPSHEVAIEGRGHYARENEVGEILVKGPCLMKGYYRAEEETSRALQNGWLHTGDLGFISEGRLFITGRAKEMIIKRGRNYYPNDIERAAASVVGVRKGCLVAFSTPNPNAGTEDLVLVVETRETNDEAKRRMENGIAAEILGAVGIKPDRILLVPPRSIPKTSSGKLQRLLTRSRYLDGSLVRGVSERWFHPVKALVSSFIGHQRFRLRARNP